MQFHAFQFKLYASSKSRGVAMRVAVRVTHFEKTRTQKQLSVCDTYRMKKMCRTANIPGT